jgi:hypothetical protein
MAANDNITITVVNFRGKKEPFTISRNITIMALQQILFDKKDFLIFEDPSYPTPTIFNIRLCMISDGIPVIFNKLDRTLADYNIDKGAVINALFDPIDFYYNTNAPPSDDTLSRLHSIKTGRSFLDSLTAGLNGSQGGKRSRRKSRRKSRRSRKH